MVLFIKAGDILISAPLVWSFIILGGWYWFTTCLFFLYNQLYLETWVIIHYPPCSFDFLQLEIPQYYYFLSLSSLLSCSQDFIDMYTELYNLQLRQ